MGSSSNGGVPPGFRFHPTDEELLQYYLKKKISFQKFDMEVVREVDLNKMEPWDLQERCKIGSTPQNEWYFFSHKDRKYPTGSRTNRATNAGFWKATGRDKCIRSTYKKIGMRKTLVFYRGRAPHGQKTDWIMHEYRLEDSDNDPQGGNMNSEDGWVVCRVFKKKNLFKIGNEGGGGGSSINSDQQQQQQLASTARANLFNMHRDTHNYGLLRQQQQQPVFELNKPADDLALHYSGAHLQPSHQYSLFPSAQLGLIPSPQKPLGGGYDYGGSTRDCESGSDHSFRYGGSHHQQQTACEPGLEVGTSSIDVGNCRDQDTSINSEWAMLVAPHPLGNDPHPPHHQQDSSKGMRFEIEDANPTPVTNHMNLRGEMNFWPGYNAK